MAYAQPRSCNQELTKGATEGGERQTFPNRGGFITSPPNSVAGATAMVCTLHGYRECC